MARKIYRSGPFVADPVLRQLQRGGQTVPVTPKVFDLLLLLLQSENRIVSREDLSAGLWPGQIATEANLNQHIALLRRLLCDGQEGYRFVATLPGRGYQWVIPVEVEQETVVGPVPPARAWAPRWVWIAGAAVSLTIIGWAALVFRPSSEAATAGLGLSRHSLTRLPGSEYQPVLSRDGAKVAFVWDQEGKQGPAIFVKGSEDDEPRKVSGEGFEYSSPAWSPDGRQLAYLRYETGGLKLVVRSERGGEERVVTDLYRTRYGLNCRHLDWSPDGATLVVDDKQDQNGPLGLYLVDLANGAKTPLMPPADGIIGDVDPRFSPDGSQVAFVRLNTRFRHDLFTIDLKGQTLRQRTTDQKAIGGHDWSADGRRLFFSSNRAGEFQIWALLLDETKPVATGLASPNPLQLSTARANSKLVFCDVLQDLNIYRLDLAAALDTKAGWSRVVSSTGEEILPQLSPDGRVLCFRSDRSGEGQLWISEIGTGKVMQITRGPVSPVAGRWSPDSRAILFNDGQTSRMYAVDTNGGTPRLLGTKGDLGVHPMFSHDGQAIYFNQDGIGQLMLDGRRLTPLFSGRPVHQKMISSDGRYLYFTGGRTDTAIWRFEFAAGQVTKVLDTLLPGYWGAWALGRHGIYFLAEDEQAPGGAAILFHSFETARARRVAHYPGPLPPIGTSLWSLTPDERSLYCVRVDLSHSDLTLLDGFR
jgi:Tol biopolymer transport system component/DNA-binding winged helix-turn-helix (wHTH) protein